MAMRIGGLASGMDIDTLVSDLMKAERMPLDKLTQKKQTLEWQRDDYRSMNTLLSEFDKYIFDNMTLQKDFLKKTSTSSMPNAVTATANAASNNVTTNINVTRLATSTNWISNESITYNKNTTFPSDTVIRLKVTNGDGTPSTVKKADNTTSDTIEFTIKKGSTVDEVLTQMSSIKELGITAFAENGQVVMSKNDTGSQSKISLENDAAKKLFTSLGFIDTDSTGTPLDPAIPYTLNATTQGVDAEFTINGLQTTRASNTFTINNVTYTLNDTTDGKSANISVKGDTDNMVDKITQFVNKYNEMIEKINGELKETRYRDYHPLSDEEKEAMSEKQVELWEEKARSGLLKNDSILSGALTKMRTALYAPFTGTGSNSDYSQLAQIGIKTTSNYLDNGKLTINEDDLRAAIEADPNAVFQLFSGTGSTTETQGITKRLRTTISDTIKSIEEKAGKGTSTNQQFLIGRNLIDINSQIDRFENRLLKIEDRYWRQFTAMGKAIQNANSQSMYLSQQFGF